MRVEAARCLGMLLGKGCRHPVRHRCWVGHRVRDDVLCAVRAPQCHDDGPASDVRVRNKLSKSWLGMLAAGQQVPRDRDLPA